jgi:hypothetical protein
MRNRGTIGGLPEEISRLEEFSAESGGIGDFGRSANSQAQAREDRNLAGSCRMAVWWPVWQHLWLTGSGEGKGEPFRWHPAVRAFLDEEEMAGAHKQIAVTVASNEMARIFQVISQQSARSQSLMVRLSKILR